MLLLRAQCIASDVSPVVAELVQRADPKAHCEYCDSVSTEKIIFYLFAPTHDALVGFVLIGEQPGHTPIIVDPDTSLLPFGLDSTVALDAPIQKALTALFHRHPSILGNPSEISTIGRRIDEIIGPISGIRFGMDSMTEIFHLSRTGQTFPTDPETAFPGSIIISSTHFAPNGNVSFGHARILGFNGKIYSVDVRCGSAWARNFTSKQWQDRFSGTNGTYAFVLRVKEKGTSESMTS